MSNFEKIAIFSQTIAIVSMSMIAMKNPNIIGELSPCLGNVFSIGFDLSLILLPPKVVK